MKKILVIHDSFDIPNQGTILIGRSPAPSVPLRIGQEFLLILKTGENYILTAIGIQLFPKCFSEATQIGILVASQLVESEVFADAELWIEA
jgi:hypothetical protein